MDDFTQGCPSWVEHLDGRVNVYAKAKVSNVHTSSIVHTKIFLVVHLFICACESKYQICLKDNYSTHGKEIPLGSDMLTPKLACMCKAKVTNIHIYSDKSIFSALTHFCDCPSPLTCIRHTIQEAIDAPYADHCLCTSLTCLPFVRGIFCDGATCRAKDDHDVDLGLDKRESKSNPKFNQGPKTRPKG